MTITVNGSGTITGISQGGLNDGIITKAEMATGGAWAPAGTVLQVVNATNTTSVSTTSTTYASTGTTATITPTSSSSKILILFSQQVFCPTQATTTRLNLYRNAGSIRTYEYPFYAGTSTMMAYTTGQYLDSPATTSATSYTIYFNSVNSVNVIANYTDANGSPVSSITLMEIAA